MASRYWDRKEEKKTGGCMADGLRCCIWARSQSPGTVSLDLVKGWSNMRKEAPLGNLGLAMEDLAWHAGTGLPEPTLLSRLPLLHFLALKLVHFFVDYHPDWIASLRLPPSDGTHKQLGREHFQPALRRLENMPETDTPLQLFSAVNISHKEWRGVQTVHATPFKKPTPRQVSDCICRYTHVYTCIRRYLLGICMYSLIFLLDAVRTSFSSFRLHLTIEDRLPHSALPSTSAGMDASI